MDLGDADPFRVSMMAETTPSNSITAWEKDESLVLSRPVQPTSPGIGAVENVHNYFLSSSTAFLSRSVISVLYRSMLGSVEPKAVSTQSRARRNGPEESGSYLDSLIAPRKVRGGVLARNTAALV